MHTVRIKQPSASNRVRIPYQTAIRIKSRTQSVSNRYPSQIGIRIKSCRAIMSDKIALPSSVQCSDRTPGRQRKRKVCQCSTEKISSYRRERSQNFRKLFEPLSALVCNTLFLDRITKHKKRPFLSHVCIMHSPRAEYRDSITKISKKRPEVIWEMCTDAQSHRTGNGNTRSDTWRQKLEHNRHGDQARSFDEAITRTLSFLLNLANGYSSHCSPFFCQCLSSRPSVRAEFENAFHSH